jgi:hypothetical protein
MVTLCFFFDKKTILLIFLEGLCVLNVLVQGELSVLKCTLQYGSASSAESTLAPCGAFQVFFRTYPLILLGLKNAIYLGGCFIFSLWAISC